MKAPICHSLSFGIFLSLSLNQRKEKEFSDVCMGLRKLIGKLYQKARKWRICEMVQMIFLVVNKNNVIFRGFRQHGEVINDDHETLTSGMTQQNN